MINNTMGCVENDKICDGIWDCKNFEDELVDMCDGCNSTSVITCQVKTSTQMNLTNSDVIS